jgi:ribosomal protein L16/L10AE
LDGVPEGMARECLRLADAKLSVRSRFVNRSER